MPMILLFVWTVACGIVAKTNYEDLSALKADQETINIDYQYNLIYGNRLQRLKKVKDN